MPLADPINQSSIALPRRNYLILLESCDHKMMTSSVTVKLFWTLLVSLSDHVVQICCSAPLTIRYLLHPQNWKNKFLSNYFYVFKSDGVLFIQKLYQKVYILIYKYSWISNPLQSGVAFLYPLKTSENL